METTVVGSRSAVCKSKNVKSYQKEVSLHRAWAGLQFDRKALVTLSGQPLRILNPGTLNHNQGPDFLDAEIQIGDSRHHGHVELHIESGDWWQHGHHLDPHYNPVMLHVFLVTSNKPTLRLDGTLVPELCLGDSIHFAPQPSMASVLPCSGLAIANLPPSTSLWMESAGIERLKNKAQQLKGRLQTSCLNWSQMLWEEIGAALGGTVNASQLRQLAQQMPWLLVQKVVHSQEDIEALLFGSCGMLSGLAIDDYHRNLQSKWDFLRHKHGMPVKPIPFKFHRMHPAGFPTVRISQMARIATVFQPLSQLLAIEGMQRMLTDEITGSGYWTFRHRFGDAPGKLRFELGQDARQRLLINALAPLAILSETLAPTQMQKGSVRCNASTDAANATLLQQGFSCNEASLPYDPLQETGLLKLFRNLPPENNKITRQFVPLGLKPSNALEAQGLIGIHKTRCTAFKCLECEIGKRAMGLESATNASD